MKKILVIGETCEDVFIYGKITRLSPEAPVPVFIKTHWEGNQGMAKNVEKNAQSVYLWLQQTNNIKFKVESILSKSENVKTRYVDEKSNHYLLRIDEGDETHNSFSMSNDNLKLVEEADTIIISDYNKGFLTEKDILNIYRHSKLDSLIIIDSKKILTPDVMEVVAYIKMNETEYHEREKTLLEYYGKTIITLGERGAKFRDKIFSTKEHTARDVSGAGDTFLAAFAVSLTCGFSIRNSIKNANKFASRVVLKRGVSTI